MNREYLLKLAQEIWGKSDWNDAQAGRLERFAALVSAKEREECAKVCEDESRRAKWNWDNDISGNKPFWNGGEQLASSCAAAIRARGKA